MSDLKPNLLADQIAGMINGYVQSSPRNYCELIKGRYFENPLVGFARGDDPIFEAVSEQVGPESMTPCQALGNSLRARGLSGELKPGEVSVISWVLPINPLIREKNRAEKDGPAVEWSCARNYGEEFNLDLRRRVVGWLEARGLPAAAPILMPEFRVIRDPARRNFTSTWSERHTAFACGLGTFSLNDALITPRGIAHRLGSVVVAAALPESGRPYSGHMEYCIADRGCRSCIKRCPVNAISEDGHDKDRCYQMTYAGEEAEARRKKLGFEKTGCGLCQTGVPCEERIPRRGEGL